MMRLARERLDARERAAPFAQQRLHGRRKRLAVDDSAPYRAFLDATKFKKNEPVKLVAIARALDGTVAVSAVASFRVRRR